MRNLLAALVMVVMLCGFAVAGDAQSVADENARVGRLRHANIPGHLEGLGMASTKEQAYRICCYASRKDLVTVDVGYAKGRNGMWFCCRRYLRRSK